MRLRALWLLLLLACSLNAQGPPPPPFRGGPPPGGPLPHHPHEGGPGPMDRSVHVGPPGRWWSDPRWVQVLQLTGAQQRAMDRVIDESRARLMELNGNLRKEEADLKSLISAEMVDEPRILGQLDRVAGARAELEKANGRMLLGLRKVLDAEQWRRLQADEPGNRFERPDQRP